MPSPHAVVRTAASLLLPLLLVACGGDGASAPEREGAEPADSTTTSAAPDAVGLCEVLTTEPFEVRRAALTASEPEAVEAAKDECSNAMRRVEAAVEVMETADALDTEQFDISLADQCVVGTNGVFQSRLSIRALDVPVSGLRNLGVAGTVRVRHDGDEIPGSIGELYDMATLSSGASSPTTTHIEGQVPADAASNQASLSCVISASVYFNDRGPVDAGLDHPHDPALADPDPAVWFPALVEAERRWREAGDAALVATTVDIRHPGYLDLVAEPARELGPFAGNIDPCFVSNVQDDRAEITYAATIEGSPTVYYVTFRRGHDGAWRRLIDPAVLGTGVGCEAIASLYQHRTHEALD